MIKINKVDVNDLDVLSRIDVDNFEDAWTKEMFKSELEHENAEYYGLFNDGETIGFCGGWLVADEYQVNFLHLCNATFKIKRCKKSDR